MFEPIRVLDDHNFTSRIGGCDDSTMSQIESQTGSKTEVPTDSQTSSSTALETSSQAEPNI